MKNGILISVIVTVYNVGNYLRECLDSIIMQSYNKLEIILIDDGSTDDCGAICDDYAEQDARIKVLHKENEGLVAARKSGILMATGDYVAYVDGDDWLDQDYYECMVNSYLSHAADVIISGCIKESERRRVVLYNNIPKGFYDKEAMIEKIYPAMLYYEGFYKFGIQQYLWNKMFKKDLLNKWQMHMDDNISNGEDVACVYPLLLDAESIEITEICKYHYRIHPMSMTAKLNEEYPIVIDTLYTYLDRVFKSGKYEDIMKRQLLMYYTYMVSMAAKHVLGICLNLESWDEKTL